VEEEEMKKVVLSTGGSEEFFKIAHEHAAKLDKRERIEPEIRIIFEDPADLMRALTAERVRILQTLKGEQKPTITHLACVLKRDRKAVSRDLSVLSDLGLLRLCKRTNPGHGVVTVVEPVAKKYHLTATV
jgi:predicted transcriptional regulator